VHRWLGKVCVAGLFGGSGVIGNSAFAESVDLWDGDEGLRNIRPALVERQAATVHNVLGLEHSPTTAF